MIGENRGKQFNWVRTPKSIMNRPQGAISATMARNAAMKGNLNAFRTLVSNRVNSEQLLKNIQRGLTPSKKRPRS